VACAVGGMRIGVDEIVCCGLLHMASCVSCVQGLAYLLIGMGKLCAGVFVLRTWRVVWMCGLGSPEL
jgi:hypothetical protein